MRTRRRQSTAPRTCTAEVTARRPAPLGCVVLDLVTKDGTAHTTSAPEATAPEVGDRVWISVAYGFAVLL